MRKRLRKLKRELGQARLSELSGGNAGQSGGKGEEDAAKQAADEDEARRGIMGQILDPAARERLSRIALVRPERERSLQELLVRMARSGQLRGRVTDDQLLGLLDQVAQAEQTNSGAGGKSKITVKRRQDKSTMFDDDEDEEEEERMPMPTASAKKTAAVDDDDDDIFDL